MLPVSLPRLAFNDVSNPICFYFEDAQEHRDTAAEMEQSQITSAGSAVVRKLSTR